MQLNADFTRRAVVHAARQPWCASPIEGVERRMLDRIGDEIARATSIVRYAPGSRFAPHTHGAGEEFLVLDGMFQDEHGDYPRGCYVRNPPDSAHAPGSTAGCVIFVKLRQFDPDDRRHVCLQTQDMRFAAGADRPGVEVMPLYAGAKSAANNAAGARENVRLERWAAGAPVPLALPAGGEFLVLEGGFVEHGERFERHSWLRIPAGGCLSATAGEAACTLWVKTGHLAQAAGR